MKRIICVVVILFFLAVPPCICRDRTLFCPYAATLRLVSLAPSTTEILFALGLDEEIVGVSSFCDYPAKARAKEKVGSFSRPNIEKIISLKPDVVFCTGLEQAPVVHDLKQLNINVVVSDPANLEELFASIKKIGASCGHEKEADELVSEMKAKIQSVAEKSALIPDDKRPAVFVEYWNNPLMTAGPGSFIDELIGLAGGRNIAYDTRQPYSHFSPELVVKRDPDCIILAYMVNDEPVREVKKRLGWGNIKAVKNNRVYADINPDLILRPGPRLTEGLAEIHKRLYER